MIKVAEEIASGILNSKPVQFVLIWIGIIVGGWIITQLGYNFLNSYLGSDSALSGLVKLLDGLPYLFILVGLFTALKAVDLID